MQTGDEKRLFSTCHSHNDFYLPFHQDYQIPVVLWIDLAILNGDDSTIPFILASFPIMIRSRLFLRLAVASLFSACVIVTLRADNLYIWAEETMSGVTFFFQGSLNNSNFPKGKSEKGSSKGVINPSTGYIEFGSPLYLNVEILPGSGRSFGKGGFNGSDSRSGDFLALSPQPGLDLGMGTNYSSGEPLSGQMEFAGETFATLGIETDPFSFPTTDGLNTIHFFTMPPSPPAVDNSVLQSALKNKIKKLKKKVKAAMKAGQISKAKRLGKKVKKLKKRLTALG